MGYIASMAGTSSARTIGTARFRRQGIDIVPERVRQALAESSLSFGVLAEGAGVSRQTMHNVASGKARPSAPVLEHIARRTGKTLEFFLPEAPQVDSSTQIGELQILCISRRHQEAIVLGESILLKITDPATVAEVRLCLGEAHASHGPTSVALEHVLAAKRHFESIGDRPKVAMCIDWHAWAVGLSGGDPTTGLAIAEQALLECRQLNPVPIQTEVSILQHMGAMSGMRKDYRRAAELYDLAIELATGIAQSPWHLARLYHNQSVIYHRLGLLAQAGQMMQRALALHTLAGNVVGIAGMKENYGQLLLTMGSHEAAGEHFERALELCDQLGLDQLRGEVLLGLGTVHLKRGQRELAETRLTAALRAAGARAEKTVMAAAHQKLGQLAVCRCQPAAVDREYGLAIELYEELDIPVQLRQCHREYSEALEVRGDVAAALKHMKKAAALGDDEAPGSYRVAADQGSAG